MTEEQMRILEALNNLPKQMEEEEFEAVIFFLIGTYVGLENVEGYLEHLSNKAGRVQRSLMEKRKQVTTTH